MTVAALSASIDHAENGVTLAWSVPFRFLPGTITASRVLADGTVVELVSGTDYSVTGGETDEGGTLTLVSSVNGATLRIKRVTPRAQPTDYVNSDNFPAESHEGALDRSILIDQEQDDKIDDIALRALMVPDGETGHTLPAKSSIVKTSVLALLAGGSFAVIAVSDLAKGDPGGNAMAIGLFNAASGLTIAEGTDQVRTTGWSVRGKGAANYVYDAAVDAAYVAAHPRSAFISANGRGFRLSEMIVSVDMFGALGDGATPDQDAFQAAGDTGLDIFVPAADGQQYRLTATVTLDSDGQRFWGASPATQLNKGGIVVDFDGVGILATGTLQTFENLSFTGDDLTSGRAIQFARTTNTDDMDGTVSGCYFQDFVKAVEYAGRGPIFTSNIGVSCTTMFEISWPASGTAGTGFQALPYGYRAARIEGNRGHSVGVMINSSGADRQYLTGALIARNVLDIGAALFTGGINNSIFIANIVKHANSTPVYIDAGGDGLTFEANVLEGTPGDSANSPAYAVWFDTGAAVLNLTFTGNVFRYLDVSGARWSDAVSRLTFAGNMITHVAQNTPSGACLQFMDDLLEVVITGNGFDPINSINCISLSNTPTVSNTTIGSNATTPANSLIVGSFVDGGRNSVIHLGRALFGALGNPSYAIEAHTSSSIAGRFKRTGSSLGIGYRFENDAGYFDLLGLPTGAGAGGLFPATDNAVNFGSASFRYKEIFAANGTINTSDERKKRWLGGISEAEMRAARDIEAELGFFQWLSSITDKGSEAARRHFGVRAQRVWAIMERHGLIAPISGAGKPSSRYAFLCHDEIVPDEQGLTDRFGVRTDELALFLCAAQGARLAALETAVRG